MKCKASDTALRAHCTHAQERAESESARSPLRQPSLKQGGEACDDSQKAAGRRLQSTRKKALERRMKLEACICSSGLKAKAKRCDESKSAAMNGHQQRGG